MKKGKSAPHAASAGLLFACFHWR